MLMVEPMLALALATGAMLYVVLEELIPGRHDDPGRGFGLSGAGSERQQLSRPSAHREWSPRAWASPIAFCTGVCKVQATTDRLQGAALPEAWGK